MWRTRQVRGPVSITSSSWDIAAAGRSGGAGTGVAGGSGAWMGSSTGSGGGGAAEGGSGAGPADRRERRGDGATPLPIQVAERTNWPSASRGERAADGHVVDVLALRAEHPEALDAGLGERSGEGHRRPCRRPGRGRRR